MIFLFSFGAIGGGGVSFPLNRLFLTNNECKRRGKHEARNSEQHAAYKRDEFYRRLEKGFRGGANKRPPTADVLGEGTGGRTPP